MDRHLCSRRLAHFGLDCLTLFFALVFGVATAQAQTAVCSNTPGAGERIECTKDAISTSDIDAANVDIDTTGNNQSGVHAKHEGDGNIDINVSSSTTDPGGAITR